MQKRSVKFAWAIALVAVILFYSLLYFFNTYPTTEGWGINYAELIGSGMVPYRDFYYYRELYFQIVTAETSLVG